MAIIHMYSWDYTTSLSLPGIVDTYACSVTSGGRTGPQKLALQTAGISGDTHGLLDIQILPSSTTVWAQAAYLANGMPTNMSKDAAVFAFMKGSTFHISVVFDTSTKAIKILRNDTVIATGTSINLLTTGAWHFITAYVVLHDTTGRVIVTWDGVTHIDFTGDTNNGGTTIDTVRLRQNWGEGRGETWVDDLIVGDGSETTATTPPGDSRVEYIVPNGAGIKTQFTPSAGSNWSNVDESGSPSDSDYNTSSSVGATDLFSMAELSTAGLVYGVQAVLRARKDDAGIRAIRPAIYIPNGAGNTPRLYTGTSIPVTDSFEYSNQLYQVSPDTGVAWTVDEVNALQYGYAVAGSDHFSVDAWMVAF